MLPWELQYTLENCRITICVIVKLPCAKRQDYKQKDRQHTTLSALTVFIISCNRIDYLLRYPTCQRLLPVLHVQWKLVHIQPLFFFSPSNHLLHNFTLHHSSVIYLFLQAFFHIVYLLFNHLFICFLRYFTLIAIFFIIYNATV